MGTNFLGLTPGDSLIGLTAAVVEVAVEVVVDLVVDSVDYHEVK